MLYVDRHLLAIASEQCGAFARWQVLAHGGDDSLIRRRCADGRWVRVRPGVYVVAGVPPSVEQTLWTAWLAVGPEAVASHECAGEQQDLRPVPTGRLVFTTRHGDHHKLPGVVVHQLRDLLPQHVTVLGGLPITTVPRTIVDLAAVSQLPRLRLIVENAVHDGHTTDEAVGSVLGHVARRGKRGMGKLATVLGERAPGNPLAPNLLEELLLGALLAGGLPSPVPQYPHPGRHPGPGRVDFAYPRARVIVEADGRRWHQRMADLKRDRARDNEAVRAGWITLRFMWEELRDDPADVARAVAETLASRRGITG